MQTVNILGYHAIQLTLLLHLSQFPVGIVWLYAATVKILPEIIKEHGGFPVEAVITEQIFRFEPADFNINKSELL